MGRSVLITGASGGIGLAIAAAFAREGDDVVLGWRQNAAAAEDLAARLRAEGRRAVAAGGDVSTEAGVEALFAAAEATFGPVEVLVNNAGIAAQKLFCDICLDEWNAMMGVHATGAFLCCRRALPAMIRAKAGCILNVASMWGQVGASCEVHYSAAKAALIGLSKALAKELGPSGIRVNCLAPGAVDSPMMEAFSAADKKALCEEIPLGRLGRPEEMAAAAVFLASPGAGFITGQVLGANGGMVV